MKEKAPKNNGSFGLLCEFIQETLENPISFSRHQYLSYIVPQNSTKFHFLFNNIQLLKAIAAL